MPQQVTRRAYAKVNLVLAVGPPLPAGHAKAGFHPIASWMACIDLFDELSLIALPRGWESTHTIAWAEDAPIPSPIDWPIEKDLAVRAHRLLEREVGRSLPVRLHVTKRVPVGGGLGGGSADAAAALMGLNELFGLSLGTARLSALGAALGSDVAFFIDERAPAGPALVSGLGESMRRTAPVESGVLLILPPFGTPTGPVYRAFDARPTRGVDEARVEAAARSGPTSGALFNDLLDAAQAVEPRLKAIIDEVRQITGRAPDLSGSGSTLFVVCPLGDEGDLARDLQQGLARSAASGVREARVVAARIV